MLLSHLGTVGPFQERQAGAQPLPMTLAEAPFAKKTKEAGFISLPPSNSESLEVFESRPYATASTLIRLPS